MSKKLMSGVAALALCAGVSFAVAQGTGTGGSAGSAAQTGQGGASGSAGTAGTSSGTAGMSGRSGTSSTQSGAGATGTGGAASGTAGAAGTSSGTSGSSSDRTMGTTTRDTGQAQTGQTGAGASGGADRVTLSADESTKLKSSIQRVNVKEATNINIDVREGVVLPANVTSELQPVPADIVQIVPRFRDYRIVKVKGKILIVEPQSRRVVYIIEG